MITESIFTVLLLIFAVVDIRKRIVPNILLLVAGLITVAGSVLSGTFIFSMLGGGIGFVLLFALYMVAPNKVGAGDVKLAGLVGLMTGLPVVFVSLLLTVIIGSISILLLVAFRRGRISGSIPYAPFLCIGAIISLWVGDGIVGWYHGLF